MAFYIVVTLPAVQRALVLRAAGRVPGLTLKLERVSAGWGSVEAHGVEAAYQDNLLRIPLLRVEYSGLAFLLRRELHVQSLEVPDFVLGVVANTGKAAGGATEAVTHSANPALALGGFLAPITLPFPTTVDSAELAGRVELPEGRALKLVVQGRLLAPGEEAVSDIRLAWTDANAALGAVRELHWAGRLRIRETPTGAVSQLGIDGLLSADAASRASGRGLRVNLDARHEAAGGPESVEATMRLPSAKPGEEPLLRVKVDHRPGDGRISGEWGLRVRGDQVAVLAPGAGWPAFTAEAQGRCTYDCGTGDFSTTATVEGGITQLRTLWPELAGVDEARCHVELAVERTGDAVTLSTLDASLDSANGRVLRVASLQPVSYRLGTVVFAQPENDLLRVEIEALPVRWLQSLISGYTVEGGSITGRIAVAGTADGRRVVLRAQQPLVLDALTVRAAGKTLLERARVALSPRIEHNGCINRLVVSDLSLTTAAGDRLDGSLDLTLDTAALTLGFEGALRGTLPTLLRPFAPVELGTLKVETSLGGTWRRAAPSGTWRDGELALHTAKAVLRRAGGAPVLGVTALQPLTLCLSGGGGLVPERSSDPAVRLEFGGLPLAWVQPWLADMTIDGTLVFGECQMQGGGRDWTVDTLRPLSFSGVSISRAGRNFVESVAGEIALRATVGSDSWAVENLDLQLRPGSALPGGSIKFVLEAKQDAAGHGSLRLPVTIDCDGRLSELRIEGEWRRRAAEAVSTDARLTGDTVHLRDLGMIGGLCVAAMRPSSAFSPAPNSIFSSATVSGPVIALDSSKDQRPFWSAFAGRLEVDVQRLVMESEEIAGLQAVAVCDAQHFALEKLAGRIRSAPLDARLGVTFEAAKNLPYSLQGDCTVPGFDIGAFLRAAQPGQEPTLETVLDITAKLEGQGANLTELIDGIRGDCVLKGGPGVLRIKDKRMDKARAIGGLVLALLSKDKQKPSSTAGSQLLDELREFRFERVEVSLLRAEDMNLQIRTLDIRSPDKRFTGTGAAWHLAGKTVLDYPLRLEMRLAGKGDFAALLEKGNLLDGSKDDLGYLCMRESFAVSGTLVKPDWKRMLLLIGAGLVFGK